jgi:REP element-mobilizing transposase RayT
MPKRDHLRRLEPERYRGFSAVHWTMTIRERRTGWLDPKMYYHFRELLAHSQFLQDIACPIFCLMPDHLHFMWVGYTEASDQRLAMRHFRTRFNSSLQKIGFELQDQPYDNVLDEEESQGDGLMETCEYIARNPERDGLVGIDQYKTYPFMGCLVPGYPELNPFESDFWLRYNRTVSHLRKSRSGIRTTSNDANETT